jgi:hypothetical protein
MSSFKLQLDALGTSFVAFFHDVLHPPSKNEAWLQVTTAIHSSDCFSSFLLLTIFRSLNQK